MMWLLLMIWQVRSNWAYAFKYDSTHGVFPGEVSRQGDQMEIEGDRFKVLGERDPGKLPWKEMGVDYVIESSGAFSPPGRFTQAP